MSNWNRLATLALCVVACTCSCSRAEPPTVSIQSLEQMNHASNSCAFIREDKAYAQFVNGENDEDRNKEISINLPAEADCPGYFVASLVSDPDDWKPITDRPLERGKESISKSELLYFLADKAITDEQVKKLISVDKLAAASFSLCSITDAAVQSLVKVTGLRYLNLSFCDNISDDGVELAAGLEKLRKLKLCGCKKLTDLGVILNAKGKLNSLDISFTEVSELSIEAFAKTHLLEELVIGGCSKMGVSVVDALLKMDKLTVLDVQSSTWLDNKALGRLSAIGRLKALNIDGCTKVDDDAIAGLGQLKALEDLSLANCTQISAMAILRLLKNSANVKHVNLEGCTKIGAEDLAAMKKSFPKVSFSN